MYMNIHMTLNQTVIDSSGKIDHVCLVSKIKNANPRPKICYRLFHLDRHIQKTVRDQVRVNLSVSGLRENTCFIQLGPTLCNQELRY
jgi:hypothetical protein